MLISTFVHIPGIGQSTERKLWEKGILSWDHLLQEPDILPRVSAYEICQVLEQSAQALDSDPAFFTKRLRSFEVWRLFPHFRFETAYLDIETTGLGETAEITTIALYDGEQVQTYVNGQNLDQFVEDIERFKVLVTYNGICFDIPVIQNYFKIRMDQAQLDLRYILAKLGCRGGLKGCERQLGINRGTLDGIDGAFAVLLWREYERYDNQSALDTLLAYNVEDTVNLERLMVEAYNRNIRQTPFEAALEIEFPEPPQLLFQPDPDIVATIKRSLP